MAITLSATSLGLVVPVLKDARQADGETGQLTIASSSVADFAAILLLTLFFSATRRERRREGRRCWSSSPRWSRVGAVCCCGCVIRPARDGAWFAFRTPPPRSGSAVAVLLLVALVALAAHLGLEIILGAFLAGALVGLVDRDTSSHPRFRTKIEAIGYGFLIPVFFISSGVRLDLSGLLDEPSALLRVPLFLLALLVVRGVPALLSVRRLGRSHAVASGLLQATSLPFIVTASQIGVAAGLMTPVTAAGLVCAGLLSVMIFPAIALGLLRTAPHPASSIAVASKG